MILYHQWKMAINAEGLPYLLFDLERDPDEIHNLAGAIETAEVENKLCLRILEHLVQTQTRLDQR